MVTVAIISIFSAIAINYYNLFSDKGVGHWGEKHVWEMGGRVGGAFRWLVRRRLLTTLGVGGIFGVTQAFFSNPSFSQYGQVTGMTIGVGGGGEPYTEHRAFLVRWAL